MSANVDPARRRAPPRAAARRRAPPRAGRKARPAHAHLQWPDKPQARLCALD